MLTFGKWALIPRSRKSSSCQLIASTLPCSYGWQQVSSMAKKEMNAALWRSVGVYGEHQRKSRRGSLV